MTLRSFTLVGALVGAISGALAQRPPSGVGGPDDFGGSYSLEFSHSTDAALNRGNTVLGDLDASWLRAGYSVRFDTSPSYSWSVGLQWDHARFDAPAGAPVPEDIYGLSVRLISNWRVNERWFVRSDLRPGLYTDFEDISGGDFNVPVTVAVGYEVNPDLQVLFAVNVDLRREFPVVGGPGVIWRFADGWRLSLLIPRPQIEFTASESVTLFAGGELRATAIRVAEDFGATVGNPVLNDDQVTYRELRVGGGVRWDLNRLFRLTVEGGYALDRRFEFDRGNVLLNGDGAPYFTVGVSGSY
jgi:hypothetical protein